MKGWDRLIFAQRREKEIITGLDRLAGPLRAVEELLAEAVVSPVEKVTEMARHLLSAGGKRLRPALTLLSALMAGSLTKKAILYAAVAELMHTATLIHDDVIDKAMIRRGRPTVHALWGNESAVMCGDHLYATAFSKLAQDGDIRVIRIMAEASRRVCEGEILELEHAYRMDVTENDCIQIARLKTGELMGAACQVGAIAGCSDGDDPSELATALRQYGCSLGIAFQLIDDVLDMEGSEEDLGKPVGSDLLEGKITLPVVLSFPLLEEGDRQRWRTLLEERRVTEEDARWLAQFAQATGQLARARSYAWHYAQQAVSFLRAWDGKGEETSWSRRGLEEIAWFVVERKA
ncbi:MAG: polyprenyl synthetase family protein [Armatimonadetes bacterium]|nr:polyprenyl synthetase family protein [Armatimonadota bacterium]MDW8121975.1 polyprenyl synthetase family protein [Armatimonadota bacterium]